MRWIGPLLLAIAPASALAAQTTITTSGDRLSYIYFADGKGSSMASGSTDDFQWAERYRSGNAPFLYVRDGGAAYVIRDPALLARASQIMRPQQELGKRQGALGAEQGELGRRQGQLGAEQGRLGARMSNTSARRMGELGKQMGELGRRQAALGSQQAALGSRQAELGRQQARLAEQAQPQLRALVADAVRRGVAQRAQ